MARATVLEARANLLALISALQNELLTGQSPRAVFSGLLDAYLQSSQSEYGFIGEVRRAPDGSPFLHTHAITDIAWDAATREFYDTNAESGFDFENLKTLFGHAIRTGDWVFANDAPNDPRRGGLPPGHPPLNQFLGIPLKMGARMIGLVGLANRPGGYDQELADYLAPLNATAAAMIRFHQAETERAAAERALAFQKDRLDMVIEGAGVGTWDWDVETDQIEVNERFAKIGGRALSDIAHFSATDFSALIYPDDLAAARSALRAAMKNPAQSYKIEGRMRHADGRWVWFRDTGRVVARNANGRALRMVGTRIDIDAERTTLDQIMALRNRLEAIVDSAPDGIVTVDANQAITHFNHAAERIFGWKAEDIIGKPIQELVPQSMRGDHPKMAAGFMARPGIEHYQMANWRTVAAQRKDGTSFPALVTLARTGSDDTRTVIALVKDVTELEDQRQELSNLTRRLAEQLQEARRANDAKSNFLAAMSHELRTPLNAIIGFSELISFDQRDLFSREKVAEYARDITAAGRHLLALINDVLDLSRIEEGKLTLLVETTDCASIFPDVLKLVRPGAEAKKQTLVLALERDRMPIRVDLRAINQVLINLLSNAVKFTPEGGRIVLSAREEAGMMVLAVEDNGPGIPADRINELGQPFVQIGAAWEASQNGLGLGLAISRRLAEMMGGQLRIESNHGAWTRVSVTVPLA